MQIQAYQFIKYDKNTSIEHVEKTFDTGAVICFDFEDGIINPFNMDTSALLKKDAREQFIRLYELIYNYNKNIKVGIRLNYHKSIDFEKDLIKIKGKIFDSIFIPKIEQSKDIHSVLDKLKAYKIEYKNLIPIIESKKGIENFEHIIQSNPKLSKIAFGHCDYNLNIGSYPFFHQDSWEYWKWIKKLISKCRKHGIHVINSPYLNIDNEEFFQSMRHYIAAKKKYFFGQITLSTRQSEICKAIKTTEGNFKDCLENKNNISVDEKYAFALVEEFESNNKLKGLTKSNKRLISLQEYIASKKIINDNRNMNDVCFVGGCFPVQHNIVYEDLFHQKLKRKIEARYKNKLNVNIIRYGRFSTLLDKIRAIENSKKIDLIVLHVRPDPYLRIIKIFYKYINDKGRLKWSLNLPYFNLLNPEKYDVLDLSRIFQVNEQRKSLFHKFLISCNYLLGIMIGNKRYALKSYYMTTNKIIEFCDMNSIKYIILGPNRRNNNRLEPSLCKDLDLYFSNRIDKQYYICGFENDNTQKMNQENGIYATQAYHNLIAEKLNEKIIDKKLLSPTSSIFHREFRSNLKLKSY